jgi:subtilisin family serine protease
MKRRVVAGVFAGAVAAVGLAWLGAAPAGQEDVKKAREVDPAALKEALRAMTAFRAGPQPDVRKPLVVKTPFTNSYYVVHVEFVDADHCNNFKSEGANVFNRFERFGDVFIDARKNPVDVLFKDNNAGIAWFDFGSLAVAPPPPEARQGEKTREVADKPVRGGVGDTNGKGVIVVVVDTGLDFHHPDFITYDGDGKPTSRLLYFWDTASDSYAGGIGSRSPVSFPNGASVGTVFSRDDLTTELRSARPKIHVWDTDGHGTGCASIAAGNGNRLEDHRYAGVAPQADLIAVRIQDSGPGLENAYLLNAICGWVNDVASKEGKPAVITCSFGGHGGGHDGNLVDERQLSARFPAEVRGRAICIAAGNEGYNRIHAAATCGAEAHPGVLKWVSFDGGRVEIYTDTQDKDDVLVKGESAKQVAKYVHGLTHTVVVNVRIGSGTGQVEVYTKSGREMKVDAYISASHDPRDGFDDSCRVSGKQIASPAAAAQAITVGSYDFDNVFHLQGNPVFLNAPDRQGGMSRMTIGALSSYSNPGPGRTGVVKPDVVAPGQWWTAAAALNTQALRDTTGGYRIFNGTSAATPYAAGIVALLMQRKPTITLGEIKGLIRDYADKDDDQVKSSGRPPNPEWGYGKLNLKAVTAMLEALR